MIEYIIEYIEYIECIEYIERKTAYDTPHPSSVNKKIQIRSVRLGRQNLSHMGWESDLPADFGPPGGRVHQNAPMSTADMIRSDMQETMDRDNTLSVRIRNLAEPEPL